MRWWPAGAPCPRQKLILYELLRFDIDVRINSEKISTTLRKEDTDFIYTKDNIEKISMPNCMDDPNSTTDTEKISMPNCKDDTNATNDTEKISMHNCKDDANATNDIEKISTPSCKKDTNSTSDTEKITMPSCTDDTNPTNDAEKISMHIYKRDTNAMNNTEKIGKPDKEYIDPKNPDGTNDTEKIRMAPFDLLDEQMRRDFGKWYTPTHRKTNDRR